MAKVKVTVDVVSDIMCPWCFIGKRNLEEAIKQSTDLDVTVKWRPYQLDATLPPEGKDRQQYLNDKFGGEARAQEIYQRIKDAGKNVDLDFQFDKIKVSPNTLNLHRLIHYADEEGAQDRLVNRLFELYFLEGENVGDLKVLTKAAGDVGLDAKFAADYLESDKDLDLIKQQIVQAQQMGVTGVPFFIINLKHAIPGAVPAIDMANALQQIAAMPAE